MTFWGHLPTLIEQSLNSKKFLPSGLTFSSKNRSRYVFGYKRWNIAAFFACGGVGAVAIPWVTPHTGAGDQSLLDRVDQSNEDSATSARIPVPNLDVLPIGDTVAVSSFRATKLQM